MYESFFGLSRRPFPAAPDVDLYFPSASAEAAREALARCVSRGDGPAVLIGGAGLGKSLLLSALARSFTETMSVATLRGGRLCSRRALLQAILFDLDLPYRDLHEGDLRLSLVDHVIGSEGCRRGLLLLVDEAHTLPLRLLDELRMITNIVQDASPRVRLVLTGDAMLEERLGSPKLQSLNQRVAARVYLEPLSHDETCRYVRSQLSTAANGGDAVGAFEDAALTAIHIATDGIPRLINQLADHALLMASIGQRRSIDAAGVEEAWADLQQLPRPWPHEQHGVGAEPPMTIEFGVLDEPPSVSNAFEEPAFAEEITGKEVPEVEVAAWTDEPIVAASEHGPDAFASAVGDIELPRIENEPPTAEEPPLGGEPHPTKPQAARARLPEEVPFDNPFDEPFEEEEVIDRVERMMAALPWGPTLAHPGSSALEEGESRHGPISASETVSEEMVGPQRPRLSVVADEAEEELADVAELTPARWPIERGETVDVVRPPAAESDETSKENESLPASPERVEAEQAASERNAAHHHGAEELPADDGDTVPALPRRRGPTGGDRDLLVVEESPETAATPQQQSYRDLFVALQTREA